VNHLKFGQQLYWIYSEVWLWNWAQSNSFYC